MLKTVYKVNVLRVETAGEELQVPTSSLSDLFRE